MGDAIIIVNEMKQVAAATSTALADKGFTLPVYFTYGHPKEVANRLQALTNSPTEKAKMFPLIWLFTDITINRNEIGFYGSARLRLLVANYTEGTYTAEQRTTNNFIPILHPIKEELINQIGLHKQFTYPDEVTFQETDMYYYGSQYNDKNVLNDRIDAIEIKDLQINITNKIC